MHSVLPDQEMLKNEAKQEVEIESIKVECENFRISIEELQNEIKKLTTRLAQATVTCQNEEKELKTSEEQKKIKARTYELLQDDPENIKKLESIIEASTNKLINLANQWEKHRVPLIKMYRQEREKHSTKAVSITTKEYEFIGQYIHRYISNVEREPKEVGRDKIAEREGEGTPGGMSK